MGPGSTRLHCQGTTVHLCMYIVYIVLLYIHTHTVVLYYCFRSTLPLCSQKLWQVITANFVVLPPSMKGVFRVFPDFSVEMAKPMKVLPVNKCFHPRKFLAMYVCMYNVYSTIFFDRLLIPLHQVRQCRIETAITVQYVCTYVHVQCKHTGTSLSCFLTPSLLLTLSSTTLATHTLSLSLYSSVGRARGTCCE